MAEGDSKAGAQLSSNGRINIYSSTGATITTIPKGATISTDGKFTCTYKDGKAIIYHTAMDATIGTITLPAGYLVPAPSNSGLGYWGSDNDIPTAGTVTNTTSGTGNFSDNDGIKSNVSASTTVPVQSGTVIPTIKSTISGTSGGSSAGGTFSGSTSGGSSEAVSAPAPAHMFTLIKGNAADDVYVLNNRGERFHVSGTLMSEMQAGGSWYEPEVKPQDEVNGMVMRYTVDSTENLGTINNAVVGNNMMLIKGNGPTDVPNDVLVGNGNAVFAVDTRGERYHVTEGAFNQLINANGGTPPIIANITQAAVDSTAIEGSLNVTPSGSLVTTDPLMDQVLASTAAVMGDDHAATPATPATPAVPASSDEPAAPAVPATPATPAASSTPEQPADESMAVQNSAESTGSFRLIKGNGGDLPDDQLVGNGRAVYVVNSAGQKFHVTGQLYNQMVNNGTWKEPEQLAQGEVDGMKSGSSVSLTTLDQLRSINIGAGNEFKLVKGTGGDLGDSQLAGNGAAVYALTSTGDRYHIDKDLAAKMGGSFTNIETLNQTELDSLGTMRGSVKSIKELNSAVKDQSTGAASGFYGDSSAIPGGMPPMPGYAVPK